LDYDCTFGLDCCSINPEKSCSDLGGDICFADEDCSGDETYNSVDQKSCCLTGSCVPSAAPTPTEEETECKKAGGGCYTSCTGNEEESTSLTSSCDSGEKCCVAKAAGEEAKSYWWIWVLLILILLIILAIVFRDKLRPYWEKLFKKKPTGPRPSTLGLPSAGMPPAMPQRRILPPSAQRPMPGPRPAPRPAGQTDDVLKKLREMGK
ncbi:MAG TPA: hypothetical protein VJH65_01375, partial [Candidatus Nanoarchaeia archaeon]|nr:hypothetical protein [Candidatus Nanoarchaeia archaeon]